MNIAVDARELAGHPTGVGRYLAELPERWADMPDAQRHTWRLYSHEPIHVPQAFARQSTVLPGSGGTRWEQATFAGALKRDRPDVVFSPGYTAPLTAPAPIALTIHDVSFAAHPEWFRWREGLRRRTLTRFSARRARRVLTVSEFSKREIVRELGVDEAKVEAIYSGVTSSLYPVGRALSRSPLVLYVGSIFNRRHVPELIEGFARVARRRPDVHLEIVGDNRTTPPIAIGPLVRATGTGDRIRVRDYVSDDELASLYGRARVFAFLSEYEGFGLTPLEALGAGIPVVVLDTPVAREIYGEAAMYVRAPDPPLIETALEQTLFDNGARQRMIGAARDLLPRYSWPECAAKVLRALESAGHE